MKILLLSDIHGNYPALEAISRQPEAKNAVDLIFNCGDSTVYAPFPNETLDWLREHEAISILGNTDIKVLKLLAGKTINKPRKAEKRVMYSWTADHLKPANIHLLKSFTKQKKMEIAGHIIGLFHGSPEHHNEFLFRNTTSARFEELAGKCACDIIITGHSHSPYHKKINGVHFINPGSVGRMFDGSPDGSYAILELKTKRVQVRHFRCPYDIGRVISTLRSSHLPLIYDKMYRLGRKLN